MSDLACTVSGIKTFQTNLQRAIEIQRGPNALLGHFVWLLQESCGIDKSPVYKVLSSFRQSFEAIEHLPPSGHQIHRESINPQACVQAVAEALLALKKLSTDAICQECLWLHRHVVALNYRFGKVNQGWDPDTSLSQEGVVRAERLIALATEWKKNNFYIQERGKQLNIHEQEALKAACLFPEFSKTLLMEEKLRNQFFEWILISHQDPKVFILFPHLTQKLMGAELDQRLAKVGNSLIELKKIEGKYEVQLPFEVRGEVKKIDVLNPSLTISFNDRLKLTSTKVIDSFQEKLLDMQGPLECMDGAIRPFDVLTLSKPNGLGQLENLDLSQEEWYFQLAPLFRLNQEKAKDYLGDQADGKNWFAIPVSSRKSNSLTIEDTHTLLMVAIPKDGEYQFFPFGKFPKKMPSNWLARIKLFADTCPATIAWDDGLYRLSSRHFTELAMPIKKESQKRALMQSIKEDILKGRAGKLFYQFQCENCLSWVVRTLVRAFNDDKNRCIDPSLFKTSIWDVKSDGVLGFIFEICKLLGHKVGFALLVFINRYIFGSRRSFIDEKGSLVSVDNSDFTRTGKTYHPGNLPRIAPRIVTSLPSAFIHT